MNKTEKNNMNKISNIQLKKYFALSLIIISALWILYLMKGYFKPILLAVILSFLIYPLYNYLSNKTKKEVFSAISIIILLILVVIIPLSTVAGVILNYVNNFNLDEDKIVLYEDSIFKLTGMDISIAQSVQDIVAYIKVETTNSLPEIVSFTSNFLISMFIMFFVMFYLFIGKDYILKNFTRILPFSQENSKHLLNESGKITKAILIGQVLTAIIQGLLGMLSFIIAGVDGFFFWGFIMIVLSLMPVIGAFIVWVPVGILLILEGNLGMGIFVLVWGGAVVSQVDNIIRPKLVNKFANIHPIETLLGVFMGLTAFGMIGIVLGPLILSLFAITVKVYLQEYS